MSQPRQTGTNNMNTNNETKQAWRDLSQAWLEAQEEIGNAKKATYRLYYQDRSGKFFETEIVAVDSQMARQIAAQHLRRTNAKFGKMYNPDGTKNANFHRATAKERKEMFRGAPAAYRSKR